MELRCSPYSRDERVDTPLYTLLACPPVHDRQLLWQIIDSVQPAFKASRPSAASEPRRCARSATSYPRRRGPGCPAAWPDRRPWAGSGWQGHGVVDGASRPGRSRHAGARLCPHSLSVSSAICRSSIVPTATELSLRVAGKLDPQTVLLPHGFAILDDLLQQVRHVALLLAEVDVIVSVEDGSRRDAGLLP